MNYKLVLINLLFYRRPRMSLRTLWRVDYHPLHSELILASWLGCQISLVDQIELIKVDPQLTICTAKETFKEQVVWIIILLWGAETHSKFSLKWEEIIAIHSSLLKHNSQDSTYLNWPLIHQVSLDSPTFSIIISYRAPPLKLISYMLDSSSLYFLLDNNSTHSQMSYLITIVTMALTKWWATSIIIHSRLQQC